MNIFLSHGTRKFSVPRKPEPPTMKKRWNLPSGGETSAHFKRTDRPLGKGGVQAPQRDLEPKDSLQQRDRARPSPSIANSFERSEPRCSKWARASEALKGERNSGFISMAWRGCRT